jgi:N utilization substance protein B
MSKSPSHKKGSSSKPKKGGIVPRSRALRLGRALALRALYAADLSGQPLSLVWRMCGAELLYEGGIPKPDLGFTISAHGDLLTPGAPPGPDASLQPPPLPDAERLGAWAQALATSEALREAPEVKQAPVPAQVKEDKDAREAADLALRWIEGLEARRAEIDEKLQLTSKRWKLERMSPVDRNVLRIGVFELLERLLPPRDVIYDCVELGRLYGDEPTPGFINGILDQFCRDNKIAL